MQYFLVVKRRNTTPSMLRHIKRPSQVQSADLTSVQRKRPEIALSLAAISASLESPPPSTIRGLGRSPLGWEWPICGALGTPFQ